MNDDFETLEGAIDIRRELERRRDWTRGELEKAIEGRRRLTERIEQLQEEYEATEKLLRYEVERWARLQPELPMARFANTNLADACMTVLKERGGEASNEEVMKALKEGGVFFGSKTPKRVVHFCFLGLKAAGKVKSLGEGKWRIASDWNGPNHVRAVDTAQTMAL